MKKKKPYMKPEMAIIPPGSPKYEEIIALLKEENAKLEMQEKHPPPTVTK